MGRCQQQDPSGETYMYVRRLNMAGEPSRPQGRQTSNSSESTPPPPEAGPEISDQAYIALFRAGPAPPSSVRPVMARLGSVRLRSPLATSRVPYSTSTPWGTPSQVDSKVRDLVERILLVRDPHPTLKHPAAKRVVKQRYEEEILDPQTPEKARPARARRKVLRT